MQNFIGLSREGKLEVVYTDERGFKSVDYIKLTPVLIEAKKEQ